MRVISSSELGLSISIFKMTAYEDHYVALDVAAALSRRLS
jgi:hypothetical protein